MTLSAPARVSSLRSFRPGSLTRKRARLLLVVEFSSPDGRVWQAIGGGETLEDAIAVARDGCPAGASWQPVRWNDLYGD